MSLSGCSGSDDDPERDPDILRVAIHFQLYSIAGELDAEFPIDDDASIGQVIACLNKLEERPRIWYENNQFTIGKRTFDVKDEYFKFMGTDEVKANIRFENGRRWVIACLVKQHGMG